MRNEKQNDQVRVIDIYERIRIIRSKMNVIDYDIYFEDRFLKLAFERLIEIIGEAVIKLSDEFKQKYSFVEWHKIAGMRNRLIHEYHKVNYNILWEVLSEEIPVLETQIEKVLENEKIDLASIYSGKWNFNIDAIKEKLTLFFKDKPVIEIYQYYPSISEIEDLNLYVVLDEGTKIGWEINGWMEQLTKTLQRKVLLTTEGDLSNSYFKKEWLDGKELIYKK
ncbi:MAG: DUF86 domain-containing protein [Bacteroidota bacterium]|nr:DUF86 domain-containing protein [Bacteroidota bacterium]